MKVEEILKTINNDYDWNFEKKENGEYENGWIEEFVEDVQSVINNNNNNKK